MPSGEATLEQAGIIFAITSGRPPRGMSLIEPLELGTPIAVFNGGLFARPDTSVIEHRVIPDYVTTPVIELLGTHGMSVWVYRARIVHSGHTGTSCGPRGPDRQTRPDADRALRAGLGGVAKIVGGVVRYLSKTYKIRAEQIATIGDMPNEVLMFARAGLSIAMGNPGPEVQRAARCVTTSK